MKRYRFWLDQLPAELAEQIKNDKQVGLMWIKKEFNSWLIHGDYQEVPAYLRAMNQGTSSYVRSGPTDQPTAFEIDDDHSLLPWILISTSHN